MFTAMDYARRAFYAAHYARLQAAGGADPAVMIEAAHYYLRRLAGVDHAGYERLMGDIERMVSEVSR